MYCYSRPIIRSPTAFKVARNASFLPSAFTSYNARVSQVNHDVAPFFRLLDDFVSPLAPAYIHPSRHAFNNFGLHIPVYKPRFDVKEAESSYELRGELPGVAGLEVNFTDPQTLVIRGRTEDSISSSEQSASTEAANSATNGTVKAAEATALDSELASSGEDKANDDAASTYSTGSYQKPSVEEADPEGRDTTILESSADAQARATEVASTAAPQAEASKVAAAELPQGRYWYKERSVGSFERTFTFDKRVDVDNVKATLKNGLLSIVVPKASKPEARRITVE